MPLNPTAKRPTLTEAIANGPTREEAKDTKLSDLLDGVHSDFRTMRLDGPRATCANTMHFASTALDEVGAATVRIERAIRTDVATLAEHGRGHDDLKSIERYLNRATRALRRIQDARRAMESGAQVIAPLDDGE